MNELVFIYTRFFSRNLKMNVDFKNCKLLQAKSN